MALYAVPHPYHRSYVSIIDDTRTMSRTVAVVDPSPFDPAAVTVIPLEGPLAGISITHELVSALVEGLRTPVIDLPDSYVIADAYMSMYRQLVDGYITWYPEGTPQQAKGPAGRKFTPATPTS